MFGRRAESPTLSPRNTTPPDQSPRKTPVNANGNGNQARAKVPSPRPKDGRNSTPVFGRRKASPRGEDVVQEPNLASPPLSARELVADASTLAALDTFLQEEE